MGLKISNWKILFLCFITPYQTPCNLEVYMRAYTTLARGLIEKYFESYLCILLKQTTVLNSNYVLHRNTFVNTSPSQRTFPETYYLRTRSLGNGFWDRNFPEKGSPGFLSDVCKGVRETGGKLTCTAGAADTSGNPKRPLELGGSCRVVPIEARKPSYCTHTSTTNQLHIGSGSWPWSRQLLKAVPSKWLNCEPFAARHLGEGAS